MSTGESFRRAQLSDELISIDDELKYVDDELNRLRRRRQDLATQRKKVLARIDASSNSTAEDQNKWENDGFDWSEEANEVLHNIFKLPSFRPLQRAAINAVMSKEDAIIIMNTGGGKSLCYQLPALLSNGLSLVVSPLISLVEDQLAQLKRLGIESATLNQNTSRNETARIEKAITQKESSFRLLYVTPEKLAKSKRIMNKLEKSLAVGYLKLIAIDEVHCCSQWGHDFRKDYAFLNVLKRQFKGVPILGLTATATQRVLDDVKDMLNIPTAIVFRAGFNRPNLHYEVHHRASGDQVEEIAKIINNRFSSQSGIVYCFSRKDCEEVAKVLRNQGISASHYHAYLEPDQRSKVHEHWCCGKIKVIVATIAFGMGIDKPDVRFVIHHCIPKSVENFYQESGRAGRDGDEAFCIMFYRLNDVFRQSTMICTEKTGLNNLYNLVRYAIEPKRCRREVLADHFEENYESSWCQQGCDNCASGHQFNDIDITPYMEAAATLIEEQKEQKGTGKITGSKLIELLIKSKREDREYIENIIGNLLLRGFLEEDFHFTPYTIISYIRAGPKWKVGVKISINIVNSQSVAKKRKIELVTL